MFSIKGKKNGLPQFLYVKVDILFIDMFSFFWWHCLNVVMLRMKGAYSNGTVLGWLSVAVCTSLSSDKHVREMYTP